MYKCKQYALLCVVVVVLTDAVVRAILCALDLAERVLPTEQSALLLVLRIQVLQGVHANVLVATADGDEHTVLFDDGDARESGVLDNTSHCREWANFLKQTNKRDSALHVPFLSSWYRP